MNGNFDIPTNERKPAYSYGLPHGYHQLDLQPSLEGLEQTVRQINQFPDEERSRADQVFRLYVAVVMMLQKQDVQGCGFGVHSDDEGRASLSVLIASSIATAGANPKLALTMMMADGGAGVEEGLRPVEIPVGTGFLMESVRKASAPGRPAEGKEGPRQEPVWHGLVAIPDVRSSSLITLQIVTPSVELADDYRSVLLGVARTVTFTDPALEWRIGERDAPDPDAEAVKNVFG